MTLVEEIISRKISHEHCSRKKNALIVVDMQNDFMDGGVLGIDGSRKLVPSINNYMKEFDEIVLTQDNHPPHHVSFCETHGVSSFSKPDSVNTVFPTHCVMGTVGSEFVSGLDTFRANMIIRKGMKICTDSPSAFFETSNSKSEGEKSGLEPYLRGIGVQSVHVCGVALDYCVLATAIDAVKLGFVTSILIDASAPAVASNLDSVIDTCEKLGIVVCSQ